MMMTLGPSMVMMVKHRRKILRKNIIRFYPPLPRINVENIYASNAGAELTKKCDTKMLFGFLTPPSPQSMLETFMQALLVQN